MSDDELESISLHREAWIDRGLRSEPSDRPSAQSAVIVLYERSGYSPPEFIWTESPSAATAFMDAESLGGLPRLGEITHEPSASIACMLSRSRERMDARIARLPTPHEFIRRAVLNSLHTTMIDAVATAIRTTTSPVASRLSWYGQQESHRVAYYDCFRRFGYTTYGFDDNSLLDLQATLATTTGWWWAFDDLCVMAERPSTLTTEPTPQGEHGERRLHASNGPALAYSDGSSVFALHGTIVPEWVIRDPTAERISGERNVEVRRSAIERLGWETYIDLAGLEMVDQADDPGNPGCRLQLYDMPSDWGPSGRILLVVNGSVERDGVRRRYGLPVPEWAPSALDAAGWTYGISGADYATLARRT